MPLLNHLSESGTGASSLATFALQQCEPLLNVLGVPSAEFAYRPVAAGGDFAKLRKDPYVREELIQVFAQTDGCSVRLRKLESGRAAIEAVRRALEHGSFALGYRSEKQRSDGLNLLPAQIIKDEARIDPVSPRALYGQALESFYGDETMVDYSPKWIRGARLELRSFVSYLTDKDPYFPAGNIPVVMDLPAMKSCIPAFEHGSSDFIPNGKCSRPGAHTNPKKGAAYLHLQRVRSLTLNLCGSTATGSTH